MVRMWAISVVGFSGFSVVLQGCGSGNGGKTDDPELRTCNKKDPSGDDLQALHKMNWGYRISGSAPLLYTQSKPLFQFCTEDVDLLKQPETKATLTTSETAEETNKKLGVEVGVSGSYGCFSAAASMSTEKTKSSKYKTIRVDRKIRSRLYHVAVTTTHLHEKLTEDARNSLINDEPSAIVDRYGEFFATEAEFGGLLTTTSMIEMTEGSTATSITAEAEAGFGAAGLKVGVHSYDASLTSDAKERRELTILGGDQAPWLAVADAQDIPKAQSDWAKTVKGNDMYVISTKLKPIWELLEGHEDAKAKEIKDYLTKLWKEQQSINYGVGEYVPQNAVCPEKFSIRQEKLYPGVLEANFFCTTSAPTCTSEPDDCKYKYKGAHYDHTNSDCDKLESACWTGEKVVCVKPTKCCEGYKLNKEFGTCEKTLVNVTIV